MSLYNMLFGVNPFAAFWLGSLGVDGSKLPRFRDCFLNGENEIIIMTRTGGNNREDYQEGNTYLRSLPGFLRDRDDEFDSTYAHWHYAVPKEYQHYADKIKELGITGRATELRDKMEELKNEMEKTAAAPGIRVLQFSLDGKTNWTLISKHDDFPSAMKALSAEIAKDSKRSYRIRREGEEHD